MTKSSLACFATYRPQVPLDIFSCPAEADSKGELLLSDGECYNQNCRPIPAPALQEILRFLRRTNPALADKCGASTEDVEKGLVTGVVFVSEREDGLEALHVALRFGDDADSKVKVLRVADIYGAETFGGARMEDSPCVAVGFTEGGRTVGHSLVYVSTKEPVMARRTPWTVVYRTRLADGRTERLTPPGQYDLSPAVSPSGKLVAVANFQWNEWTGEIENLKTHIAVMNVDRQARGGQLGRKIIIRDGGWPTWGSDNILFFHRWSEEKDSKGKVWNTWGVFRHDISRKETRRVTPCKYDAMTPAAMDENRVAVATIQRKNIPANIYMSMRAAAHCRHIEIFDSSKDPTALPLRVTKGARGSADHFNPSVLNGGTRIGYHRGRTERAPAEKTAKLDKLQSPPSHADVELFRTSHAFPAVSKDGKKLAYVDNQFKTLWLWVEGSKEPRRLYKDDQPNVMFSPMWHPTEDTLLVCRGPSFSAKSELHILAFPRASTQSESHPESIVLTVGKCNNAFPSFNEDGTKLVFRSTRGEYARREGDDTMFKNLYVLENTAQGEHTSPAKQLTSGSHVDTHCSWAPRGDLIVFSSTRDKPSQGVPKSDNGLDPGYFAVYLVNAKDKTLVRVVKSGVDLAGHVNHPVFSPDRRSIAFTSDLAAVSADPISLPLFLHSVRPYGDIFAVDIDPEDIRKNKDVEKFHRLTHSRYEYSMPAWTYAELGHLKKMMIPADDAGALQTCPYDPKPEGKDWVNFTGHLCLQNRCC